MATRIAELEQRVADGRHTMNNLMRVYLQTEGELSQVEAFSHASLSQQVARACVVARARLDFQGLYDNRLPLGFPAVTRTTIVLLKPLRKPLRN